MSTRLQQVLLRGFKPDDEQTAAGLLVAAGYAIVQTLAGADLMVLGLERAERSVVLAQERQLPVLPWAEMELRLRDGEPRSDPVPPQPTPLFQFLGERIRILDLELPCAGRSAPDAAVSADLCFDEPFLRAVRAVASGVLHGFPTALEGVTAASKTTAVIWLARLLGQRVIRLNLNGQTDTGELIGRYVPAREGDDWELASLAALGAHLQPVTRDILRGAAARPLTWGERVVVSRAESIHSNKWRFQEGIIPRALRQGHWVLLDEMNLAEPQILERLNPVLEDPPGLMLSEGDQTVWGRNGLPIHPDFRLFATLNPAEYAGRSVMSPAFRDRWINWFHTVSPGEREYLAHLRLLVFGEQPEVVLGKYLYQAPTAAPRFPELALVDDISVLLENLARFHATLAQAAAGDSGSAPALGRSRRERYVFSRRGLMACLRLWASHRRQDPQGCPRSHLAQAMALIYLARLVSSTDRKAARSMASAAGLPLEATL